MIKIDLDGWEAIARAYGTGVLIAGHQFVQAEPDWYARLGECLIYAVAWPYSAYKVVMRR